MVMFNDGPKAVTQYIRDHYDLTPDGLTMHGFLYFDKRGELVHSEVYGDLNRIIKGSDDTEELLNHVSDKCDLYDVNGIVIFVRHENDEAYICKSETLLLDVFTQELDGVRGLVAVGLSSDPDVDIATGFGTVGTAHIVSKMLDELMGGMPPELKAMMESLMGHDNGLDGVLSELVPEGITVDDLDPSQLAESRSNAESEYNYVYDKSVDEAEQARRFIETNAKHILELSAHLLEEFGDTINWPPASTAALADMKLLVEETQESGKLPSDDRLRDAVELQKAALTEKLAFMRDAHEKSKPSDPLGLGALADQMRRRAPAPSSLFDVPAIDLLGSPYTDDKPQ